MLARIESKLEEYLAYLDEVSGCSLCPVLWCEFETALCNMCGLTCLFISSHLFAQRRRSPGSELASWPKSTRRTAVLFGVV